MSHADILYLAIAAVVAGGAGVVGSAWRRSRVSPEEPLVVRSLVRVITDEDDLKEALERAARFEEMVARAVQSRADRYRAMATAQPGRLQTPARLREASAVHIPPVATHPLRRARRRVSTDLLIDETMDANVNDRHFAEH